MDTGKLFDLLSDERKFIKAIESLSTADAIQFLNSSDPRSPGTLLQAICRKGLSQVIHALIQKQIDGQLLWKAAADEGNVEIFETLLDQLPYDCRFLMNRLMKKISDNCSKLLLTIDHEKCFVLLIEQKKKDKLNGATISDEELDYFNHKLYYAAELGCDDIVAGFLQLGVSLADPVVVVDNLEADILENHLNRCISRKGKAVEKSHQFSMSVIDPRSSSRLAVELDYASLIANPLDYVPETELIRRLAKVKKLRHLLPHPVLQAFLLKKWDTISAVFFCNVALYAIFVASLIANIYINYSIDDKLYKYGWFRFCHDLVIVILAISLGLLLLREALQLIILHKNYFTNWENYFEISTFIFVLLSQGLGGNVPEAARNIMYSLTIPLVMFQFTLLLSKHPKLIFMLMFQRAAFHFIKLFLWFLPLIIGFPLSFHMLLPKEQSSERKCEQNFVNNVINLFKNAKSEDGATEFNYLGTSLFKTLIMLTGEYDANSINFDTYPFTSRLIFIVFIFVCSIVLISLLNGLAVSDIQSIRNDTDLIYYRHLTQYIHDVETVIISIIRLLEGPPAASRNDCLVNCLKWTNLSTTLKNTLIFHDKQRNEWRLDAWLCTNPEKQKRNKTTSITDTNQCSASEMIKLTTVGTQNNVHGSTSSAKQPIVQYPLVKLSRGTRKKILAIFRNERKMKTKKPDPVLETLLDRIARVERNVLVLLNRDKD